MYVVAICFFCVGEGAHGWRLHLGVVVGGLGLASVVRDPAEKGFGECGV